MKTRVSKKSRDTRIMGFVRECRRAAKAGADMKRYQYTAAQRAHHFGCQGKNEPLSHLDWLRLSDDELYDAVLEHETRLIRLKHQKPVEIEEEHPVIDFTEKKVDDETKELLKVLISKLS